MTKLASAFGEKYQQSAINIRTKSFEIGGHTFKVRVPLNKEIEEMDLRMESCDPEQLKIRYEKMALPFKTDGEKEGIEILDDDVIVDGRSFASITALRKSRVTPKLGLLK